FRRDVIHDGFLLDPAYREVLEFEYWMRSAGSGKTFQYLDRFLGVSRPRAGASALQHARTRRQRIRVQRRWSPIAAWDMDYDVFGRIYHGKRAWHKLFNGSYRKEWRARREAGRDLAWFRTTAGLETCSRLVSIVAESPRGRGMSAGSGA